MARKKSSHLGVEWALPGRKRHFTTTTAATSDLITIYAEDGSTWRQIVAKITYDVDALAVCQTYIDRGYGDTVPKLRPLLDENSSTLWWPGKRAAILEADAPIGGRSTKPFRVDAEAA